MSALRVAAQQALEAWQVAHYGHPSHHKAMLMAMTALRAALAQQAEPVAWMVYTQDGKSVCVTDSPSDFTEQHHALPLYTAPTQRKPLSEEKIRSTAYETDGDGGSVIEFARAIERAHGIGGSDGKV